MAPAALVMAGGRGTRMATSHPSVPKPLVPVGGLPLLEICLRKLAVSGIARVYLALHHQASQIAAFVDGSAVAEALDVRYLIEETPRGTIGSLAALRAKERSVLVLNGDLLSGIDLVALGEAHRARAADLTIATHTEYHRLTLGEVVTAPDGRMQEYREKPVKEYRISSGTYLISERALALVPESDWLPFPDVANRAVREGLDVFEFHHDAPWLDVNTASDLAAADRMLREDPIAFGIEPDLVT